MTRKQGASTELPGRVPDRALARRIGCASRAEGPAEIPETSATAQNENRPAANADVFLPAARAGEPGNGRAALFMEVGLNLWYRNRSTDEATATDRRARALPGRRGVADRQPTRRWAAGGRRIHGALAGAGRALRLGVAPALAHRMDSRQHDARSRAGCGFSPL